MKKLIVGLLSMVLVFAVQAQNSKQVLKDAEKALKPFFDDMAANIDDAKKIVADLEANFGTPEKPDRYIKKGELYMKIVEEEEKLAILNPAYARLMPEASNLAYESFKSAMGTKKQKDALKKLDGLMSSITFIGNSYFDVRDYTNAFKTFSTVLDIHKILKENDKDSSLDDPTALGKQKFYTLVAGTYSDEVSGEQLLPLAKELYDTKYDHSFVYESYFTNLKDTDKEKAIAVLQEGREKYPDDNGLLYAEINYYLTEGNLEEPISRIKLAIEKDPENVSLYTTLGNVYDQLNQKSREAGDTTKANQYFGDALKYFEMASEKNPDNFDASYSIGALYYNRAASMTSAINELASDYSSEGTKKYEATKARMNHLFEMAKPHFEKALSLNGESQNALIALKEIYARLGDFDKSNEMKARLESLGG